MRIRIVSLRGRALRGFRSKGRLVVGMPKFDIEGVSGGLGCTGGKGRKNMMSRFLFTEQAPFSRTAYSSMWVPMPMFVSRSIWPIQLISISCVLAIDGFARGFIVTRIPFTRSERLGVLVCVCSVVHISYLKCSMPLIQVAKLSNQVN